MPVRQETLEEVADRVKLEREKRESIEKDKQAERDLKIQIAKVESIPNKTKKWELLFNSPARFVAIICAYKLLKNDKPVPDWMAKFIGGKNA